MIVVAQGQWNKKKMIVQIAFFIPKPPFIKREAVSESVPSSESSPPEYPIAIIGRAISFAGRERINPERIVPSRPKSFAKGLRNEEKIPSTVFSPIKIFEHSQIIIPAGIATRTALPSVLNVLSKTEFTIIFFIFGRR